MGSGSANFTYVIFLGYEVLDAQFPWISKLVVPIFSRFSTYPTFFITQCEDMSLPWKRSLALWLCFHPEVPRDGCHRALVTVCERSSDVWCEPENSSAVGDHPRTRYNMAVSERWSWGRWMSVWYGARHRGPGPGSSRYHRTVVPAKRSPCCAPSQASLPPILSALMIIKKVALAWRMLFNVPGFTTFGYSVQYYLYSQHNSNGLLTGTVSVRATKTLQLWTYTGEPAHGSWRTDRLGNNESIMRKRLLHTITSSHNLSRYNRESSCNSH